MRAETDGVKKRRLDIYNWARRNLVNDCVVGLSPPNGGERKLLSKSAIPRV
jgi:hypothetical protein